MPLPSVDERAQFISWAAPQFGIDPNYALTVARREGLQPNTWQSSVVKNGIREPSYGDFQLYMRGGLGNRAARDWNYDPTNPENWKLNTLYALMSARQGGWGPWYGARAAGITGYQGINRNTPMPADVKSLAGGQPTGTQDMPYDARGAGMLDYGPIIPLPNSPFQQGGGGGQVPVAGSSRAKKQLEAYRRAHAEVGAAIEQLMAQRQQGRGGILGPALLMGLAGAASRAGGPGGGLVAGLASGLASGMRNRGQQDLANKMAQLQLLRMKEGEVKEGLPKFVTIDTPSGKMPATQYPGEPLQPGWEGYGQGTDQGQTQGQPQAQGSDPFGLYLPNPENISKAVGEWKNQTQWLTSRGIPSYSTAVKLYDEAAQHPSVPNDMALLQALRTLSNPGAMRSAGVSEDQVAAAESLWDRWDTLMKQVGGSREKLPEQTRDEIMDTINRWFKPQYEQAQGYAENNKQLWKGLLRGAEDKAFYLPEVKFRDVDLGKYPQAGAQPEGQSQPPPKPGSRLRWNPNNGKVEPYQ